MDGPECRYSLERKVQAVLDLLLVVWVPGGEAFELRLALNPPTVEGIEAALETEDLHWAGFTAGRCCVWGCWAGVHLGGFDRRRDVVAGRLGRRLREHAGNRLRGYRRTGAVARTTKRKSRTRVATRRVDGLIGMRWTGVPDTRCNRSNGFLSKSRRTTRSSGIPGRRLDTGGGVPCRPIDRSRDGNRGAEIELDGVTGASVVDHDDWSWRAEIELDGVTAANVVDHDGWSWRSRVHC